MSETNPDVLAARAKLFAKKGDQTRIGGKGTTRRKNKAKHQAVTVDSGKLQSTIKKLPVQQLQAVEEVNFFRGDGGIVHFKNPTVQANLSANTYFVSGKHEMKSMSDPDMLGRVIQQMGAESMPLLKQLASQIGAGNEMGKMEAMMGSDGKPIDQASSSKD